MVKIRGRKEDVDAAFGYLEKLHNQLLEEFYSLNVPMDKEFHKILIGKGGENIRRIRQETSTRIYLPDEKSNSVLIEIIGRQSNVEKARDIILQIQNDLRKTQKPAKKQQPSNSKVNNI